MLLNIAETVIAGAGLYLAIGGPLFAFAVLRDRNREASGQVPARSLARHARPAGQGLHLHGKGGAR